MADITYFDDLLGLNKKLKLLIACSSLLTWDSQTYMPSTASSFRSEQLALIENQIVTKFSNKKTSELIKKLEAHKSELNDFQKRNFDVFKKAYIRRTAIPKSLLIENKKQELITFSAWQNAKRKNDYSLYKTDLEKNIENKKKMASHIDSNLKPFDIYLDQYEPGFSAKRIERIFETLKPKLISLLKKVQTTDTFNFESNIDFSLPKKNQIEMINTITSFIGYDLKKGSIDSAEHPMTTSIGTSADVRITVNYDENDFRFALFGSLHEAGHAIHYQNTQEKYLFYPVTLFGGSAGISESQSRFFENIVGRSPSFWKFYLPKLCQQLGKNFDLHDFLLSINKVQLSKIRIKADELTYPLHIILRFAIEKEILDGSILVNELPSVWNEKFENYFGFRIDNNSDGIMQDIHWATSFYGYFPTYALGNIYNSQMYFTMKKELDFESLLENGDISPIRTWLNEKVHKNTGFYEPEDFVERITSEPINPDYFIKYLTEKYTKINQL